MNWPLECPAKQDDSAHARSWLPETPGFLRTQPHSKPPVPEKPPLVFAWSLALPGLAEGLPLPSRLDPGPVRGQGSRSDTQVPTHGPDETGPRAADWRCHTAVTQRSRVCPPPRAREQEGTHPPWGPGCGHQTLTQKPPSRPCRRQRPEHHADPSLPRGPPDPTALPGARHGGSTHPEGLRLRTGPERTSIAERPPPGGAYETLGHPAVGPLKTP